MVKEKLCTIGANYGIAVVFGGVIRICTRVSGNAGNALGVQGTIIKGLAGVVLDGDTAVFSLHLNEIGEILHRNRGVVGAIKSEDFCFLSVLDLPDITLVTTGAGQINRSLFRDPEFVVLICKVSLCKDFRCCAGALSL